MDYKITIKDCKNAVRELTELLAKILPPSSFDLIVYGSYATGNWRDGLSDMDAILYFNEGPFHQLTLRQIREIQLGVMNIYEKSSFLREADFFVDTFVVDKLHGGDGRFMIYDEDFVQRLLVVNKNYSVAWGGNFLSSLSPVRLRHQEEFQMAMYLQEIRKFLLFKIPWLFFQDTRPEVPEVYKFFKTLPRFVHIILGEPINSIKEGLDALAERFHNIDYTPLYKLREAEKDYNSLQGYLRSWYAPCNPDFIVCWLCYEQTLAALVAETPMRSEK